MTSMNQGTSSQHYLLLLVILATGIFLRLYDFPNLPPGFHRDEASVGYESFSLMLTASDRWGIPLPVYFISWGSGQSVLYSYLSVLFIYLFGLGRLSIRLLSVIIGILTLPLAYVTIKRALGERAALLSTLLLAWMPWHVMISRWALDANLLPFFLLLGTYTVSRALDEQTPFWTVVSLLPWGLGLYAYAVGYFVVPAMLVLVILFYREVLVRNWRNWLLAFLLFGFLTLPIALFLFKNFIVRDLNIERLGVLGIPLLPFSRLVQISSPIPDRWVSNLFFVVSGFQDSEVVNTISGVPLIFMVVLPLTLVGSFYLIRRYRQSRVANLFLLWLAACLPVFLPWKLTSTHVNAIYIPMLAVAAFGFFELRKVIRSATSRKFLAVGVSMLVALHGLIFAMDYFFVYPRQPETELAFYRGFDRAIAKSLEVAKPADSILVTDRILLPYIMVAFYSAYPPDRFHREVYYAVGGDAIEVASLGRFYFGMDHLPDANAPFTYVLAKWDEDPCPNPQSFLETRLWKVGRCN